MRKMLLWLSIWGLPGIVLAQSVQVPLTNTNLDVSGVVSNLHPAYVYDQHRDNLAGAYIPALQFHDARGVDLLDLNIGIVWRVSDGIGGPLVAAGIRVDNLMDRVWKDNWVSTHVSHLPVPQIEAGPFAGFISRLGWLTGLFISTKLGK